MPPIVQEIYRGRSQIDPIFCCVLPEGRDSLRRRGIDTGSETGMTGGSDRINGQLWVLINLYFAIKVIDPGSPIPSSAVPETYILFKSLSRA